MFPTVLARRQFSTDCDRNALKRDLCQLEVNLPASFLWEPTSHGCKLLFQAASELVVGGIPVPKQTDPDELRVRGLETIADLDSHSAFDRISLLREALKVSADIGVEDVGLVDIVAPDIVQVQNFCAAFVGFAQFKNERLQRHAEKDAADVAMTKEAEKTEQECEVWRVDVAQTDAEVARQSLEIENRAAKFEALQSKIKTFHEQFVMAQNQLRKEAARGEELRSSMSQIEMHLAAARDHRKELEEQIVRSPRRLKKSLVELVDSLDAANRQVRESHKQKGAARCRRDVLLSLSRRLDKAKAIVADIHSQLQACTRQKTSTAKIQDAIVVIEAELKKQTDLRCEMLETEKEANQKLIVTKAQYSSLLDANSRSLSEAEDRVVRRTEGIANERLLAERLECKAKELGEEMVEISREREEFQKNCSRLCDKIATYVRAMRKFLANEMETIAERRRQLPAGGGEQANEKEFQTEKILRKEQFLLEDEEERFRRRKCEFCHLQALEFERVFPLSLAMTGQASVKHEESEL